VIFPRGKPYRWKADDGVPVEGMLVYPPGKFEARNLPMLTLIHGGPADADGNHFEADWYQWSALRNISGLIDQKILVQRFQDLAKQQRSCHSCHMKNNEIYPCGVCSKCLGILLYLLANKTDPTIMNYRKKDIEYFYKNVGTSCLDFRSQDKIDTVIFIQAVCAIL
jgi:hypothetical protein